MPLRDRLLRSTLTTVAVVVAVIVLPSAAFGAWHVLIDARAGGGPGVVALGGGLVIALGLLGGGVGAWLARRDAERLARPMAALAGQAEALGRRPGASPVTSGVAEIDSVSEVLRQRAVELTQRLAHERQFASDASHHLRTPLTALLIRLEEISMLDDPVEMRAEATSCIEQVERLTRVVDDLLRRTPAGAGGNTDETSLDSVLAALQREWQPAFSRARRSIKIAGERGLRLRVRRDDLAQIISTLLENTLEHGSGLVEVEARRTGPSVVLEMTDEGAGIDPGIAPHVFERRVTTGGTGLGLALARDLAQSNGGRLELLEAQPARFALFLSAADGEAEGSLPA